MKTYAGNFINGVEHVTVNGAPLDPRFDLANHSPSGFAWGYGGSGPAQLAIAILADCIGPINAIWFYQDFKWQVVCHWEVHKSWTITDADICAWLVAAKAERDRSTEVTLYDADRDDYPVES